MSRNPPHVSKWIHLIHQSSDVTRCTSFVGWRNKRNSQLQAIRWSTYPQIVRKKTWIFKIYNTLKAEIWRLMVQSWKNMQQINTSIQQIIPHHNSIMRKTKHLPYWSESPNIQINIFHIFAPTKHRGYVHLENKNIIKYPSRIPRHWPCQHPSLPKD